MEGCIYRVFSFNRFDRCCNLNYSFQAAAKIRITVDIMGDIRKFYGEEIEMKNILRNRDFSPLKPRIVV